MFLIARRQLPWRAARQLCSWLYWGTFIPMRCILYPIMVPVFLREMQLVEHAPWWHTTACVGAQVRRRWDTHMVPGMQGCTLQAVGGRCNLCSDVRPSSAGADHNSHHLAGAPISPVQIILTIFNYVLLALSLMRQRSKGAAAAKAAGKPAKAAAASNRALRDAEPELVKPVTASPLRLRARGL